MPLNTSLSQTPPRCPDCGGPMNLRIARRGWNRGKQFWGCTNYPRCKGIVNIENEGSNFRGVEQGIPTQPLVTPVVVRARERFPGYEVTFFETLGLPEKVLNEICSENIDRDAYALWSKWRLDIPVKQGRSLELKDTRLLTLAYKLLTRGRLTLVSPRVENTLASWFKIGSDDVPTGLPRYSKISEPQTLTTHQLDSESEKKFIESVLPKLIGKNIAKYLLPQTEIFSIAPYDENDLSGSRVDFLLTNGKSAVVIEIDDESPIGHPAHVERDESRDTHIVQAGYEIIRITNDEVNAGNGADIEALQNWCSLNLPSSSENALTSWDKYLVATKLVHQLQIVAIEALIRGHLSTEKSTVYVDTTTLPLSTRESKRLLTLASDDLNEFLTQLMKLYSGYGHIEPIKFIENEKRPSGNSIFVSYGQKGHASIPSYFLQEISFPRSISHESRAQERIQIPHAQIEPLTYFLKYLFRYEQFMEGQYEGIVRVMSGQDTILLLPTGAGKSIVYQLASLLLPGVGIVIDPIIALIEDQLDNLRRKGIDRAVGISSAITDPREKTQFIKLFSQGEYLLCYVAPERFQTEEFRGTIRALTTHTPVCLIAIDEAHCVSEWGHDFRTSYLNIGRTTREVCAWHGNPPPLIALTGTASFTVLRDVQRDLIIKDHEAIITPNSFDRKELHFNVFACNSLEKPQLLKTILSNTLTSQFRVSRSSFFQPRGENTYCGILFCPHIGGQYGIVELKRVVADESGISAGIYGGRAPDGINPRSWPLIKRQTAKDFKNNKIPLLVATKSFGMGIDKPNIRYTIHLGLPSSIESFYQEAGRAGRGINNGARLTAECSVIISNDNPHRTEQLLAPSTSPETIGQIIEKERDLDDDDVTRAMWFHHKAFKGVAAEIGILNAVLDELGDLQVPKKIITTFTKITTAWIASTLGMKRDEASKDKRNIIEKAIHRLVILGVIRDYTIDYSNEEFQIQTAAFDRKQITDHYIEYVRGFNRGDAKKERQKISTISDDDPRTFIQQSANLLIQFIYENIEKGRRRAMNSMLNASLAALKPGVDSNKVIKNKILEYLQKTYSKEIEKIIEASNEGFIEVRNLVDGDELDETSLNKAGVRFPKEAAKLRGQVSRYLESLPNHPGLLVLLAVIELYCSDYNPVAVRQNLLASVSEASKRKNVTKHDLYDVISWFLLKVFECRPELYRSFSSEMLYSIRDPEFARMLIKMGDLNNEMTYEPAIYLFAHISNEVVSTFIH